MTVTLTPEQAAQMEQILADGWFASVEEAVAHSIDLLSHEAHLSSSLTEAGRERIQQGIEAAQKGELVSQEDVEAFFRNWEHDLQG